MNNENIKIYSLNLMAFIQMQTGIKPTMHYEYSATLGQKWYGVFPCTPEVNDLIDMYKRDEGIMISLHEFLNTLKDVVNRKNAIKESLSVWNK